MEHSSAYASDTNIPNALCFGAEGPATGTPCHVKIDSSGIRISGTDPSLKTGELAVSFEALSISTGGLNHDQLVVKWGEETDRRTLYIRDPTLIRAFRQAAPGALTNELEEAAKKVRQMRGRHQTVWTVAGICVVTLVLGLWFGSDLLVELAISRIPVEWEQKIGEAAYRDFVAQQIVVKEMKAVSAINEITTRLTERISDDPYKFEVTIVKSDVVNAFALPGGHVVVFTGLMKEAKSGEEVAGVLSHELNHVLQRHGLERIVKQLGITAMLSIMLGDQQGLIGLTKQVGVELLTLKFGRQQETEADVTGLKLLYRARIDPQGMISFFERLSEQDTGRVEWLSSHPMSKARAVLLKTELAALPKVTSDPFTFEWKTVQESVDGGS